MSSLPGTLRSPLNARVLPHPDSNNNARAHLLIASTERLWKKGSTPSIARTLPDQVSTFSRSQCRSTDQLHPPLRSNQTCSLRDSQFQLLRETRAATFLHTTSD